jgi:rare lipoprotein A
MSGTKWECNLQRKFHQDITRIIKQTPNTPNFNKSNFSLVIAAGVALTFGIFGSVAAHAKEGRSHSLSGVASVYSTESGRGTASGQRLNPGALTAAHRSLPFGTKVRVTNSKTGHSVVVTINDRGPFVRGRIIDVTPAGARALGFSGLTHVTLNVGG